MRQLDWVSKQYGISSKPLTGVNIWYRSDSDIDDPDLICDATLKGQYVDFYVINGDWYGKLDMAAKLMTIYCPNGVFVVPYGRCEFIYEEESNV